MATQEELQAAFDAAVAHYANLFTIHDDEYNTRLVLDFIRKNCGGVITAETIAIAFSVSLVVDQLHKTPVASPAAPKPKLREVLKPGQLPLDATEWGLRRPEVTPAQVKDWRDRWAAIAAAEKEGGNG